MRQKIIVYCVFYCSIYVGLGQSKEDILVEIKDQKEIIDSYTEFETFYLDSEEFLDKMVDHGAELTGYYEHGRLKKIIRKIGTQIADIVTTFYFWNDQLIYVNYKQCPYFKDGEEVLDYTSVYTKYESEHYFNDQEEIKKKTMGESLNNVTIEKEFDKYAKKMKALLDNKFYNKDIYDSLQGKWVFVDNEGDHIIFEGTIRFNFYNGRFANRLKTKIENDVLICFFPMDDRMYRYKIESINNHELKLIDLSSKEEFRYVKSE